MHACRFRYGDRLRRTLSFLASFLCLCGFSGNSAFAQEDYAESFSSALLTEATHGIPERVASDDPGPATSSILMKALSLRQAKPAFDLRDGSLFDVPAQNTGGLPLRPGFSRFGFSLPSSLSLPLEPRNPVLAHEVTGQVVDREDGAPLPGVNVVVQGTLVGVITDDEGEYTIVAPEPTDVLVFSFVGYATQEIPIEGRSVINVEMQSDVNELDEVVVTGYGEQTRGSITGSVAVVDMKALKSLPTGSAAEALQGQAAGVTIISAGMAGHRPEIWVRGLSTFGDSQPLILVDGVEADLNNISATDIESVQVLKDAGAAAIYGVRGANGVVVVTTKKGRTGAPVFSYEGYYGMKYPLSGNPYNLMNSYEFMELHQQLYPGHPLFADGMPDFTYRNNRTGEVGAVKAGHPAVDPSLYYLDPINQENNYLIQEVNKEGTIWWDEVFSPAPQQSHNLSASGGTANANYLLALEYLDQEGTLLMNRLQRYSARINTSFTFRGRFRVGENLNVYHRNNPGTLGNNLLGSEFSPIAMHGLLIPTIPVYDIAGNYGGTGIGPDLGTQRNVRAFFERQRNDRNKSWHAVGNIFAEVDFLRHFTARTSIGGTLNFANQQRYEEPHPERSEFFDGPTRFYESDSYSNRLLLTNTVNYDNLIGAHKIDLLIGTETVKNYGRNIWGQRDGYFSDEFSFLTLDAGSANILNGGSVYEDALLSFFGNLNYAFRNKYLLGVTLRRDGSSRFGEESRYGVFPAFSLGWRLSEEPFLRNVSWINDLRIKGSYGILGSQNNVNPFNQFDLYAASIANSYYDLAGTSNSVVPGFAQTRIGNRATSWERNKVANIGFETFLFNRASINLDVYKKTIDGLLFPLQLPATVGGASRPAVNAGDIQNTGFDLETKFNGSIGNDLLYRIGLNVGAYKNKVVDLPGREFFDGPQNTRNQPGHPISAFFGYEVIGIYQSEEDIASSASYDGAYPGRFKYRDVDGDGVITSDDRTFIGNPHPDFTYGLLLDVTYKNFDLSANFYGSHGNDVNNWMKLHTHRMGGYATNVSRDLLNAWTPENRDTNIPINTTQGGLGSVATFSSFRIEDGSFMRLRSLILGYTLPRNVAQQFRLNNLRLYVQATNLFTITNYSGLDPEIGRVASGEASFGTDIGNYPNNERTFLFGINVSF